MINRTVCWPLTPMTKMCRLLLVSELPLALQSLRRVLQISGQKWQESEPGILDVLIDDEGLRALAEAIHTNGCWKAIHAVPAVFIETDAALQPRDLARVCPLGELIAPAAWSWLMEGLRLGGLATYFQPILCVSGHDPGRVFGYECFLRGIDYDGAVVSPSRLFEAARSTGLLSHLNTAAWKLAIRSAAEQRLDTDAFLFLNLNADAVADPETYFGAAAVAVVAASLRPERVVFEIVESGTSDSPARMTRIAEACRVEGFLLSLDDVGAGFDPLRMLRALRPDFLKLDMKLIRGVELDPTRAIDVGKLVEMARELGIASIVEGIEAAGEWEWVRAHGADYVQGFYFGSPIGTPVVRPLENRSAARRKGDRRKKHLDLYRPNDPRRGERRSGGSRSSEGPAASIR